MMFEMKLSKEGIRISLETYLCNLFCSKMISSHVCDLLRTTTTDSTGYSRTVQRTAISRFILCRVSFVGLQCIMQELPQPLNFERISFLANFYPKKYFDREFTSPFNFSVSHESISQRQHLYSLQ